MIYTLPAVCIVKTRMIACYSPHIRPAVYTIGRMQLPDGNLLKTRLIRNQ